MVVLEDQVDQAVLEVSALAATVVPVSVAPVAEVASMVEAITVTAPVSVVLADTLAIAPVTFAKIPPFTLSSTATVTNLPHVQNTRRNHLCKKTLADLWSGRMNTIPAAAPSITPLPCPSFPCCWAAPCCLAISWLPKSGAGSS